MKQKIRNGHDRKVPTYNKPSTEAKIEKEIDDNIGENQIIKWEIYENDYDEYPPKPIFNDEDNARCVESIEGFFESAYTSFERGQENQQKLIDSYQAILDKQEEYGIELTNNKDFAYWTIEDYPENSWCFNEDDSPLVFSPEFVPNVLIDQKKLIS